MACCGNKSNVQRTVATQATPKVTSIQPSNGRTEILYYLGKTFNQHLIDAGVNEGYRLISNQVNVYIDASEKLKQLKDEDGNPYFLDAAAFAKWFANGESFTSPEEADTKSVAGKAENPLSAESVDYSKLTKAELVAIANEAGKATDGFTKSEIISLLNNQ